MKPDKNQEHKKDPIQTKVEQWIGQAEEFIDETAEKIHQSDAYRKADQSVEKAAKKIFRQAGRWWGKSEHYFKNREKNKNTK